MISPHGWLRTAADVIPRETTPVVFFASVEVFQVRGHSDIFLGNDDELVDLIDELLFAGGCIFSWGELGPRWRASLLGFAVLRTGRHGDLVRCVSYAKEVGVGV